MSDWTDELKDKAVALYEQREPTPENSMEMVKEVAEEMGKSANAVRMILSQKGAYVKKEAGSKPTAAKKAAGDKPARVSKEDSQKALTDAIEAAGAEVDSEIISKLTGKAAVYFTGVLKAAAGGDQED